MSSYLDRQASAFKDGAKSAASKVATKQRLAAPISAPSPAPSNSSTTSKVDNADAKWKREPTNEVFSQPRNTGYGTEVFTQITYAVEFLKKKNEPKTFEEILSYLSLNVVERERKLMADILRKHGRVTWMADPKSNNYDAGLFKHKPIIDVRNKQDLIAYLQRRDSAQGVLVKDLKDGWPDCEQGITELENEHKLLVIRTKKDNHARMVWADDPTLKHSMDAEFVNMFRHEPLLSVDDTVRKLQEAGQKPASEDPSKRVKAAPKPKEKKKRASRRGGKTTNTHMLHLLRDSADLKRGK